MTMAKPPTSQGIEVRCPSLRSGREEVFPASEVRFRPAAYGLFLHADKVLLGRSSFTRKWDIPGGAVEPWETLEQGLAREFYEETGIAVTPGPMIDFRESYIAFFHHPFHSLRFFYRVFGDVEGTLSPDPDEIVSLAWLGLDEIDPDECAPGDYALIARMVSGRAVTTRPR